jgi:hypothetical protein
MQSNISGTQLPVKSVNTNEYIILRPERDKHDRRSQKRDYKERAHLKTLGIEPPKTKRINRKHRRVVRDLANSIYALTSSGKRDYRTTYEDLARMDSKLGGKRPSTSAIRDRLKVLLAIQIDGQPILKTRRAPRGIILTIQNRESYKTWTDAETKAIHELSPLLYGDLDRIEKVNKLTGYKFCRSRVQIPSLHINRVFTQGDIPVAREASPVDNSVKHKERAPTTDKAAQFTHSAMKKYNELRALPRRARQSAYEFIYAKVYAAMLNPKTEDLAGIAHHQAKKYIQLAKSGTGFDMPEETYSAKKYREEKERKKENELKCGQPIVDDSPRLTPKEYIALAMQRAGAKNRMN